MSVGCASLLLLQVLLSPAAEQDRGSEPYATAQRWLDGFVNTTINAPLPAAVANRTDAESARTQGVSWALPPPRPAAGESCQQCCTLRVDTYASASHFVVRGSSTDLSDGICLCVCVLLLYCSCVRCQQLCCSDAVHQCCRHRFRGRQRHSRGASTLTNRPLYYFVWNQTCIDYMHFHHADRTHRACQRQCHMLCCLFCIACMYTHRPPASTSSSQPSAWPTSRIYPMTNTR
jgi:hypothetical protein